MNRIQGEKSCKSGMQNKTVMKAYFRPNLKILATPNLIFLLAFFLSIPIVEMSTHILTHTFQLDSSQLLFCKFQKCFWDSFIPQSICCPLLTGIWEKVQTATNNCHHPTWRSRDSFFLHLILHKLLCLLIHKMGSMNRRPLTGGSQLSSQLLNGHKLSRPHSISFVGQICSLLFSSSLSKSVSKEITMFADSNF